MSEQSKMNEPIEIENEHVKYVIAANGRNFHFIDKQTGKDYVDQNFPGSFARIKKGGREYQVSSVSYADGRMSLKFEETGISAVIKVVSEKRYFVLEVLSISDETIEEFVFIDIHLSLAGKEGELFAGCLLALNLQTNVPEWPGVMNHLSAICYSRFGLAGAKAALIGCSQEELRSVMQEVVSAADELPHSPLGGPWALDAPINRGSYLFQRQNEANYFKNITEKNVDEWINLLQTLGFTQFFFQNAIAYRPGDFEVNAEIFPRGRASLKAIIDKLHAAGIAVGLHSFSSFISKESSFVTPIPHPDLAKDAVFTLAEALVPDDTTIVVLKNPGFFGRNGATLQIDNELIIYSGISKKYPSAFTGCQRGAYGTQIASHDRGTKAYHLQELFGYFLPDCNSVLLTEVASRMADLFNECGFDRMYLDALVVGGGDAGDQWYYLSKFVFEIWKRLKKPAAMEMMSFNHHFWFVRSSFQAWDRSERSHKTFIDLHCKGNDSYQLSFLPGCLGWWRILTWGGAQREPTFSDDIEYLCSKSLATDSCINLETGIEPERLAKNHMLQKLAGIIQRYEKLRLANYFPESIKAKLRQPKEEFTLIQNKKGEWQFHRIQYAKHKVERINGWNNIWTMNNKFSRQPIGGIRIEALLSAESYDSTNSVTLIEAGKEEIFPLQATASGTKVNYQPSSDQVKVGSSSLRFTATNSRSERQGTWAMVGTTFTPLKDLSRQQGLGVWIYGDGQGEILNFQVKSTSLASGTHYVVVDFTGWRYVELIEPEGERHEDYVWPYGGHRFPSLLRSDEKNQCGDWLDIYLYPADYANIESFRLWYNNLPANGGAVCYLSSIKALPLVKTTLINPTVKIGDKTIVFPAKIESGCYLEYYSNSDCKLYNPEGELICEVKPEGEAPILKEGENKVMFTCTVPNNVSARAKVTIISRGELL